MIGLLRTLSWFQALTCLLVWVTATPFQDAQRPNQPRPQQMSGPVEGEDPLEALRLPNRSASPEPDVDLGIPLSRPQPPLPRFSSAPSDHELLVARVFYEPLVPGSGEVDLAENRALANAVLDYLHAGGGENVESLADFLRERPDSRWRGSLLVGLGMVYRRTGYFSRALDTFEQAWGALRDERGEPVRSLGDRALAEYAELNARLGRYDVLAQLFEETRDRKVRGSATEMLSGARQGLRLMTERPEEAFRCGPMALDRLLARSRADYRLDSHIIDSRSTPRGMSLSQVHALSRTLDMGLQMAFRGQGAEPVTPAVVHWRAGHFAALSKGDGHRFLVEDPTFGDPLRISRAALEDESSGYFLVPEGALPVGWRPVDEVEGETVWGKGNTHGQDPQAIRACDRKTGGDGCATGSCSSPGLASYRFHSMMVSLNITDTPLGYDPPLGPPVRFLATYNQRESFQPMAFTYSNLGPKWTFDWMSYIEDDPADRRATVFLYPRGGGQETYGYDDDFGVYERHITTRGDLERISDDPIAYRLRLPDGSTETYGYPDGASSFPRRVFLTESMDARGNAMRFHYDGMKLVAVEDALGRQTVVGYTHPTDPFKITFVRDPYDRIARLSYNGDGQLASITDVIGMASEFEYGDEDFVTSLTTPYGRTEFRAGERPGLTGFGVDRWLEAADPLGGRERLEFLMQYDGVASQEAPEVTPDRPWIFNGNLQFRNSFYWSKLAMERHPGDYSKAQLTHWLKNGGAGELSLTSGVVESIKPPLENRIWFDYPNRISFNRGDRVEPTEIARVLADGTDQVYAFEYNGLGHVTRYVDPVGREVELEYSADGVDLERAYQLRDTERDLLVSVTYNEQRLPRTITDVAGETTEFQYHPQGQVRTITNALGDQMTFDYAPDRFLSRITGPIAGATVDFTWDGFGRVRTVEAEGRTLTYDYDELDRLRRITYPDGTFAEASYLRLDLVSARDRAGRTTSWFHDELGRVLAVREPSGRTASLQWCDCGALDALVDGEGNVTRWERDLAGRVTREVRADGSAFVYAYDEATGRMTQIEDPKGQFAKYDYYPDDALERVRYTDAADQELMPGVSFTYDAYYARLETRTDATGTTRYGYKAIEVPPTHGAGKLESIDGPLADDLLTYGYDALQRVDEIGVGGIDWTREFDAIGRVREHTNPLGRFRYDYDAASARPTLLTYPNGQSTTVEYYGESGDDRVEVVTHRGPEGSSLARHRYAYDARGNVVTWERGDATSTGDRYRLHYDRSEQLIGATLETSEAMPSVLSRYAYGYDDAGNRTTEQVDDAPLAALYNELNQLEATAGGGALRFSGTTDELAVVTVQGRPATTGPATTFRGAAQVDTGPNAVEVVATDVNGNSAPFVYDVDVAGGGQRFDYDDGGNLEHDGVRSYEWDALDQLTAIVDGARRTEFGYDGYGRRVEIRELVDGQLVDEMRFVYCGLAICQERDGAGQVTKRFYPQGVFAGGEPYYYQRDHLGSVREVTDASGTVRARYDYDPWGRRTKLEGDLDADLGFTGHYTHAPTELVLAPFRAYEPELGRWISPDPIGLAGGLNLYGYSANNPTNAIDPTGEHPLVASGVVGALLGGAIGAGAAWYAGGSDTDLASAAAKGALLGGLAGLTGAWAGGATATSVGGGFWGGAAAGAASGAAGDLVTQAISWGAGWQCGFNWSQFFVSVALGGAIGGAAGRFASTRAPTGGRLGSESTRQHVAEVASELESRGWSITGGGGVLPEEYIAGPLGGRRGASFPDITATKAGRTLRVNTVDTLSDGVTPTAREAAAAERIRSSTRSHLLLVPKPKRPKG